MTRLFCRQDLFAICEVPLPNGRRADMMAIDGKGQLVIVEIKVSRADLLGDGKWTDYLDYCDRFYWAVPSALASILRRGALPAGRGGAARRRPLRCRDLARGGAPPARPGAAQGRTAALRPPRRAAAVGADRPDAGRRAVIYWITGPATNTGFGFTASISFSISAERRSRAA